ncbi:MAG TPA: hypothetical protein VLZ12_13025 [Verrucomicrobiae bacterium]|nr:hypothetical protein [Verrucomicrobiae bacterium]
MNDFEIFSHDRDGRVQDVVGMLPSIYVFEHGLIPEAVVGVLQKPIREGGKLEPSNFARNSIFVNFLHRFIAERAPLDPEIQNAAGRQSTGHVYIIDARTFGPDQKVPPEDVIGRFRVEEGTIVTGSYEPNPGHVILSNSGFFKLSPTMMRGLREDLVRLQSK